jgi:hypothetical protein
MTLSIRKSRKIVVNDVEYRWSSSQDSGYMVLVAQHSSGNGRKLEVIISDDRNIVIENGNYSIEIGDTDKLIITPRLVQAVIRDALDLGWKPTENGPPVELAFNENSGKLDIRRGL